MLFELYYPYIIAIIFIVISIFPMIKNGENTRHRKWIWDDLDSNHVIRTLLCKKNNWFKSDNSVIKNMMNGADLFLYNFDFKLHNLFYKFLKPFTAYTVELFFMRLLSFISMFVFSTKYIFSSEQVLLATGVSLGFCLLPHYIHFFITSTAHPLVIYAFLNISLNTGNPSDWIILALYPFCSAMIAGGAMIIFVMCLLWIVFAIVGSYDLLNGFWAIFLTSFLFFISEHKLFLNTTFSKNKTIFHRAEFSKVKTSSNENWTIKQIFNKGCSLFFENIPHNHTFMKPFVALAIAISSIGIFYTDYNKVIFFSLILCVITLSIYFPIWHYHKTAIKIKNKIAFLKQFNPRLETLSLFFVYVLFAFSIKIICDFEYGILLAGFFIIAQIIYCLWFNFESYNAENLPSYKEFYARFQFCEIKNYIDKPLDSYRIISIGMHPMVAVFNGFHTLDGYHPLYPIEYKYKFRKIIAGELNKDQNIKNYFDAFGSRCYAFYAGMNLKRVSISKYQNISKSIDYDISAFKDMGGKYIISAIEITNAEEIGLRFHKTFENDDSYYKITLYEAL